jgi:hypothetical protein
MAVLFFAGAVYFAASMTTDSNAKLGADVAFVVFGLPAALSFGAV